MNLVRIVPFCLVLTLCGSTAALADEGGIQNDDSTVIGSGVVCNTSDQVARFADLMDRGSPQEAILTVNREASDPTACGAAVVAFQPGKKISDVHSKEGALEIREITIIAAAAQDGWHKIDPQKQYTVVKAPGMEI